LGRMPGHQTIGNLPQEAQSELKGTLQGQIRPCNQGPLRCAPRTEAQGHTTLSLIREAGEPVTAPTGRGQLDYQNMLCCCSLCKRVGIVDNRPTRLLPSCSYRHDCEVGNVVSG
jgi:hypothetical protein